MLRQQRIGTHHIPHIGEIPLGGQIAHVYHRFPQSQRNLRRLFAEVGHHELGRLIGADVVERPNHDDLHAVCPGVQRPEPVLRCFGHGVGVARMHRRILTDQLHFRREHSVLLPRTDEQNAGRIALDGTDGIQHIQTAAEVDLHGFLGIFPGERHRALGCQMENHVRTQPHQQRLHRILIQNVQIIRLAALHGNILLGQLGHGGVPVTSLHQLPCQIAPHKSAAADNQRLHDNRRLSANSASVA